MRKLIDRWLGKTWQKALGTLLAVGFLGIVAVFALSGMIKASVRQEIVALEETVGGSDCILVLGCGVKADGTPSDMLHDRLEVAVTLYERGVAPVIFLSGDSQRQSSYDEVGAMKAYCLSAGVPETAIREDLFGLSTYDSIRRAGLCGVEKPVIVTQTYHLYRALYIARRCGMSACGVSADLRSYRGQTYRGLREVLARCKDFYMTQVWPAPRYETK